MSKWPKAELWLARQCEGVGDLERAALFVDDPTIAVATWPEAHANTQDLIGASSAAHVSRRPVLHPGQKDEMGQSSACEIHALPIPLGGRRQAVLAVVAPAGLPRDWDNSFHSGNQWLPLLVASSSDGEHESRAPLHLNLITTVLDEETAQGAYMALVSTLATELGCERVSLGLVEGTEIELHAVSHSARFDRRSRAARGLGLAMAEALDSERTLGAPDSTGENPARAHATFLAESEMGSITSVPLTDRGTGVGVICFETDAGRIASDEQISRVEQSAAILGPILSLRRSVDRSIAAKLIEAVADAGREFAGPNHPGLKLVTGALALLLVVSAILPVTFRVASPARLEGSIQRAIVAPVDGYIAESRARAGDLIERGAVLGAIDPTDLRLERRKWSGRRAQIEKEYRAALAGHDRAEVRILRARLDQADAELALTDEQLARTLLTAPFDGIVARGDLSRSLGSPVERGELIFEVAPLDTYRIVLEIDETAIAWIRPGQTGNLTLSAMPGRVFPLFVERIVPVAVAEDGRNFFRAEARLEEPTDSLRPGMEGIGKIDIGPRRALWVWTHSMYDWLRIAAWSWLP